eukprot:4618611-Alexandrium_andersonii.AAC.1
MSASLVGSEMCIRDRTSSPASPGQFPGHYFIASDEESETEWLGRDGPECYRIDLDSDAEDGGDP